MMSSSSTTTERLAPVHPGEVLMEDFIKELGVTQNRVAVAIGVPPRRINEIVHGKRAITADTALRLGRYFGTSAQFWLSLQAFYDLDVEDDRIHDQVEAIRPPARDRPTPDTEPQSHPSRGAVRSSGTAGTGPGHGPSLSTVSGTPWSTA